MKDRCPGPLDERDKCTGQWAKRDYIPQVFCMIMVEDIGVEPIVTEVTLFYGTCMF